ncbi:MBL fold metallo-hydrolase [Kribbella albertanoniae]|uniref:MBL fold metallo-hydrolase n=1 Tax=Kribbella albertanoniae TaxID=1266829 RepID=A0A4R4Q6Y0_9ACTN|nr:MBL fold metallo-hydrolase [Kribbella albertanoniae]TDC30682.1 MBL fold metallo-hydrolase [Kribbella albertanoniae]
MSLSLQILGASCAVPNPGAATSCYLLRTATTTVLLECGHGAIGKLAGQADPGDLDAVVITHMHPDHCMDLVALRNYWFVHRSDRLPLHLPSNGPSVLRGIAVALELPADYFDRVFDIRSYGPEQPLTIGQLRFESLRTRHNTVANAVRVSDPDGRNLVFSSDTGWFAEFEDFARGTDLLLLELTDARTPDGPDRWHLCPRDGARIINAAQPSEVLLTHYFAASAAQILQDVSEACPGVGVELAVEGESHHVGH